MNTTNVPTEWLEELRQSIDKVTKQAQENNDYVFFQYLGNLESLIYAQKYFNHPEQSSELEEFAKFVADNYYYNKVDNMYSEYEDYKKAIPFSEVLKAFQNREK